MSATLFARAKECFLRFASLSEADQREALRALEHDPELHAEVAALLRAHDEESRDSSRSDALSASGPGPGHGRAVAGPTREQRFAPGDVIEDRYRVLDLLGRGGMGEVYRVHDRVLDQVVALKRVSSHRRGSQTRLLQELRLARKVSHPNVARVHDVGWVGAEPYITMEYVEGEDLAGLVRRAGRLSSERVVVLARQLCAALAAAHQQGVLHRDLKPANVLVDRDGVVKITDFGIAVAENEQVGGSVEGTPRYMAPEVFDAATATPAADLYALGLVLYEAVTGRAAHEGSSVADTMERHRSVEPTRPSALAPEVDPQLEAAILQLLRKDPADRPESALQAAALLPGTDALRLAADAGITPSPELVAAARPSDHGRPRMAVAGIGAVAVLLLGVLLLSDAAFQLPASGFDRPPAVMAERARETLRILGYGERPVDHVDGFLDYLRVEGASGSVQYWYRQHHEALVPESFFNLLFGDGSADLDDPSPLWTEGSASLILEPNGRLSVLEVVPEREPDGDAEPDDVGDPDEDGDPADDGDPDDPRYPAPEDPFVALLELAGLNEQQLQPTTPELLPPYFADQRRAWLGSHPDDPGRRLRIEAAALEGRAVFFDSSIEDDGAEEIADSRIQLVDWQELGSSILALLPLVVAPLAWANHRRGRGDPRGATKVALVVAATRFALWVLLGSHSLDPGYEADLLIATTAATLLEAAVVWLSYLALEPYVRRVWPQTLVAWSRLLSGRLHDPAVGGSLLLGSVTAAVWVLCTQLDRLLPRWVEMISLRTSVDSLQLSTAISARSILGSLLELVPTAIYIGVMSLLALALLRALLRSPALAAFSLALVLGAQATLNGVQPRFSWASLGLVVGIGSVWLLTRYGLLAFVVAFGLSELLLASAITRDASAWYASSGWFALLVTLAVAAVGAWGLSGRRSILTHLTETFSG